MQSINVEILESTHDFVKIKLPFTEVPIQVNHQFFKPRVENGYFKVKNNRNELNIA